MQSGEVALSAWHVAATNRCARLSVSLGARLRLRPPATGLGALGIGSDMTIHVFTILRLTCRTKGTAPKTKNNMNRSEKWTMC